MVCHGTAQHLLLAVYGKDLPSIDLMYHRTKVRVVEVPSIEISSLFPLNNSVLLRIAVGPSYCI